jgi:hypothetical protein
MAVFDFLFGEGRALAFIVKGVEAGMKVAEIAEKLSLGGIITRLGTVEKVAGYLENVILPGKQYIKQLQLNNLPNLLRIPLALTSMKRNFAYEVNVTGFSASTGEIEARTIVVSTNELLTKQQAIDIADELSIGDTKSGGLTGGAGEVTSIMQNPAGLVEP